MAASTMGLPAPCSPEMLIACLERSSALRRTNYQAISISRKQWASSHIKIAAMAGLGYTTTFPTLRWTLPCSSSTLAPLMAW